MAANGAGAKETGSPHNALTGLAVGWLYFALVGALFPIALLAAVSMRLLLALLLSFLLVPASAGSPGEHPGATVEAVSNYYLRPAHRAPTNAKTKETSNYKLNRY